MEQCNGFIELSICEVAVTAVLKVRLHNFQFENLVVFSFVAIALCVGTP